jgi:hypothetical protein
MGNLLDFKSMKTKLRYQISETTILKSDEIKDRILSKLRDYGYNIIDIQQHTIYFGLSGWGLSGNQIGKANDGTVEIIGENTGSTILLTFEINLILNIVLLICFIFAVLYFGWGALILVLAVPLFTWLDLVITKTRHKELLKQMVTDDIINGQ